MYIKVAVIVSPGEPADILLAWPELEGAQEAELVSAMKRRGPQLVLEGVIQADNGSFPVALFGCPVLPTELTGIRALREAQDRLVETIQLAAQQGASYVALAGANAVLGEMPARGSRQRLAEVLSQSLGIWISTGYRLGTWAIGAQLVALAQRLEIDLSQELVGIVGGGGRFAHKLAITLPTFGVRYLLLQDISAGRVETVADIALAHGVAVQTTLDLSEVLERPVVVIFVPSTQRPIVDTGEVPSGSVHICDTYPRVHHTDIHQRADVVATQVVLQWPRLTLFATERQRSYLDVADNHSIWPCGIEAGLAAVQGLQQNLLDPGVGSERVNGTVHQAGIWANQLGVRVAPFQAFGKVIPVEQLDRVGRLRQQRDGKVRFLLSTAERLVQ